MIRRSLIYTTLVIAGLGCGCATLFPHSSENSEATTSSSDKDQDLKKQILELQKNQSKQTDEIAELNNKFLLLKDRLEGGGPTSGPPRVNSQPVTGAAPIAKTVSKPMTTTTVNPLTPQPAPLNLPIPQNGRSLKPQGAQALYNQIIIDSKKPQTTEAQKDVEQMLKLYRNSPLTSNALYIYADLLYDRAKYNESATEFERLYKIFPDGNKAVSALYKLALCYQKMGHPQEAQEAFQNVLTVYPGSREALEAEKQIVSGDDQ